MIRLYRTFYCNPRQVKPDEAIRRVSKLVSDMSVRAKIPRICVERGFAGQPQYYLFIAFESDGGGIGPDIEAFFQQVRAVGCHDAGLAPLSRVEIRPMVSQDVRVEEFARRLRYKPLVLPDPGDPFAEDEDLDLSLDEAQLTGRFDRLLIWMSAHAEGSFATLDSARRALGIELDTRRVLRALRLLAHCETSRDGSRWSITPTTLVRVDDGHCVLTGARDESLMQRLREHFGAAIEQSLQPDGAGPSVFCIGAPDDEGLAAVAGAVSQGDLTLARSLPDLAGWAEALDPVPFDPGRFSVRRLSGGKFHEVAFQCEAGLYQFEGAGSNTRTFHLYYSSELGWRRGGWTGLRFLARLQEFGSAPCTFDRSAGTLSIPFEWRWPEIYERALVLSSGKLPSRDDDGRGAWLVYSSVERELLDELCGKLHLEVDER